MLYLILFKDLFMIDENEVDKQVNDKINTMFFIAAFIVAILLL